MRVWSAVPVCVLLALTGCHRNAGRDNMEGVQWQMADGAPVEKGLRELCGDDGMVLVTKRANSPCMALQPGTTPTALYFYFGVDADRSAGVSGPLYARVEYFDEGKEGSVILHYDSGSSADLNEKYQQAEEQAGGMLRGSKTWKTAYFTLMRPHFVKSQNVKADFRLAGGKFCVRSVSFTHKRPNDWAAVAHGDRGA